MKKIYKFSKLSLKSQMVAAREYLDLLIVVYKEEGGDRYPTMDDAIKVCLLDEDENGTEYKRDGHLQEL